MEHLRELLNTISSMPLGEASQTIYGELIQPPTYYLSILVAGYKRANPQVSWEDIFERFGYQAPTLKSVAGAIYDYHRIMRGDLGQRIMLGFPKLDSYMRGIRPGQVCGFMARAGVGKTTFACNVIVNLYREGQGHPPVLFFSLEMPAAEIAARLFVIDREMFPSKVEEYFTLSADAPLVAEWALLYHDLVIIDEGSLSLEEMSGLYDKSCAYLGKHIPLVVIDYMGLVSGRGGSNYERTSYVARGLKQFAKAKGTAVLSIVQTSREGGVGKERVTMAMARDSGQIEEACDFLIGAWRPNLGEEEEDDSFSLTILKNRHGRTTDIDMMFDSRFLKIYETKEVNRWRGSDSTPTYALT
ncbi:MAG: DnaB-like helicase C-terminal domain-containing protein [Actinomycetota bacterium]